MSEKEVWNCANGCSNPNQSEEHPNYCVDCVPDYEAESCCNCGEDDTEWDFEQRAYVCNNCGQIQ